jgi:Type II secretion system (T2SS), protein E, N-terminal domain
MPRLGELLVAAGLLTPEQVEQALRAQVLWGGRLGTNLVELHYLELDPLSRVLGRQHHLPAAFARHFEKADPALQAQLPVKIAERFSCVPLLRMGPDQHVVIAAVTPLTPRQLAIIADALAIDVARLVPAVAAELRIRYQLERVYRLRRAARYLRARGASIPPFPTFQILPIQPDAELDLSPPSLPVSTREIEAYRPDPGAPASAPAMDPTRAAAPRPAGEAVGLPTPHLLAMDPSGVAAPRSTGEAIAILLPRTPTDPDMAAALAALGPIPASYAELLADDGEDDDLIPVEVEVPAGPDGLPDPVLEDDLEDDLAIASEPVEDEALARERRGYVRTIADPASADAVSDADRQAMLGRIAIRKVAVGSAPRVMAGDTLGEATRAIRCSTGRDRVADLVIDALDRFAPACEAAILLVVRGATAIGWKGFQRAGGGLPEIAVPMDNAGLVPRAVELNVSLRRAAAELDPIDRLLLASLGRSDGDLAIVPIAIADQVMCVIAIATADNAPIACAEPIAAAAGAAFARLMRDASR